MCLDAWMGALHISVSSLLGIPCFERVQPTYRFEHPARTWASSSHRKFTHAAVGIAMAASTFRFMQETAKTAMGRVLGITYAADRAKRW